MVLFNNYNWCLAQNICLKYIPKMVLFNFAVKYQLSPIDAFRFIDRMENVLEML